MKVIMGIEKLKIKGTEEATVMIQGMGVTEEKVKGTLRQKDKCGKCDARTAGRTSVKFLKGLRRKTWDSKMGWDEEEDGSRMIDSMEALPEDLQDYECKMVLIGSD